MSDLGEIRDGKIGGERKTVERKTFHEDSGKEREREMKPQ